MSEDALVLENVSKVYRPRAQRPVRAVDDLSLSVRRGEIVALLGSSGCGKTSTLRMIAGFEEVTEGSIFLMGQPIHRLPPARRGVAMAFEGYSLYPPLTVRENIAFALKSARLPRSTVDERVAEVARLLEIEDILERYPTSISSGQQQRASLARALVREADLHLLDEPMGQLEPQLRSLLRGRIKHFVKERGLTVILVTHDQTEANALADRIAVMEKGVLQQFAEASVLKDRPANLFTGTFIGEPPMNVFEATVTNGNGTICLGLAEGVALHYRADEFGEEVAARLNEHGRVALGVRPHAVRLASDGTSATLLANQWLGDQTHLAASFAGGMLVVVEHERARFGPGEEISIAFAPQDLHFFDPDSGAAIAHGHSQA